jgi:secretion/DNA translocation related TadE-like protein
MMAVLVATAVGAIHVCSAVVARHRAQAAADMAALAGAAVMPAGSATACAKAAAVARAMDTTQTGCETDGLDVVVTIDAQLAWSAWGLGLAHAVARAGPEVVD